MKRIITLLFLFISGNLIAQDKITLLDGKVYDVKIVNDRGRFIKFYSLDDSSKKIKTVLKEQVLDYKKEKQKQDLPVNSKSFVVAQDIITSPDGKKYSVKIIDDSGNKLKFYALDDPAKKIKTINKSQIFSYKKGDSEKNITGKIMMNIPVSNRTAGDELMIAKNQLYAGIVLQTLGFITVIGTPLLFTGLAAGTYTITSGIGLGLFSIGSIFVGNGIFHFHQAGIKLNNSQSTSLYLVPSGTGAGLVYNF